MSTELKEAIKVYEILKGTICYEYQALFYDNMFHCANIGISPCPCRLYNKLDLKAYIRKVLK